MVIGGRVTDVDLALGHDDVRALALAKAVDKGPRDSRRIGLAKEGQIAEGSPAWEGMPAGDQAKRKRAAGGWWPVGRAGRWLGGCARVVGWLDALVGIARQPFCLQRTWSVSLP